MYGLVKKIFYINKMFNFDIIIIDVYVHVNSILLEIMEKRLFITSYAFGYFSLQRFIVY